MSGMWQPLKELTSTSFIGGKTTRVIYQIGQVLIGLLYSFNLLQLQQNEFFHSFQTVLVTDRVVVWNIISKHQSCFSITLSVICIILLFLREDLGA